MRARLPLLALVMLAPAACGHGSCRDDPPPATGGSTEAVSDAVLGEPPMCEASDVVVAPWDSSVLVVADNEIEDRLFLFRARSDRLEPDGTVALPPEAPHDIEALAVREGRLWVFGSHSRNRDCEVRENRKRALVLSWDGELREERRLVSDEQSWTASPDRCLAERFVVPAPALAPEVCGAVVQAAATPSAAGCRTLNIEGSADLGAAGLWLGLRAPLVQGMAVLLRVEPTWATLRFDRVALIDLGGRGVRGLSVDGDRLLVIAGPVLDSSQAHALFEVGRAALAGGDRPITRQLPVELPPAAEGLASIQGRTFVVMDGAQGSATRCRAPARQAQITVPPGDLPQR